MLYRRNCNSPLSSSLQRCYINGVCFAFQLAALWKRHSVICPWEHQLAFKCEKKGGGGGGSGTQWDDLCTARHTYARFGTVRKRSPRMREMGGQVTSAPETVDMSCSFFHVKTTELLPPPPQPGSQYAVINQSNPINRRLFGELIN